MNNSLLTPAVTESYMQSLEQLSKESPTVSDDLLLRAYIKTLGRYCSRIKIDQFCYDIYDSPFGKNFSMDMIIGPNSTGKDTIIYVVSLLDYCRPITEPYKKGDKV